jgi:high-affinity nickel permease
MCLFDTAGGCFMNFACDWAFARPVRKVFYNLAITGLTWVVALSIWRFGHIEQKREAHIVTAADRD